MGTSGGVFGLERGFCLMIGGEDERGQHLDPIFKTIAPGVESAERTPGRTGEPTPAENGYLHCGPPGAGHFVKMVHNGVEYGLMAAYAEGLNIIKNADVGLQEHVVDAETTPLRDPQYYQYEINIGDVAEVWRRAASSPRGSSTSLPRLSSTDPALDHLHGRVSDSGEGRWTVLAAVDEGVPSHVDQRALYDRFESGEAGLREQDPRRRCASSSAATPRRRTSAWAGLRR